MPKVINSNVAGKRIKTSAGPVDFDAAGEAQVSDAIAAVLAEVPGYEVVAEAPKAPAKPVDEKKAEEKPADPAPTDEKKVDEKKADEKPAAEKPKKADKKSAAEKE